MSGKKDQKATEDNKDLEGLSVEELQITAKASEDKLKAKNESIAKMIKYVGYHQQMDPLVTGFEDGMNPLKRDWGFNRCNVM